MTKIFGLTCGPRRLKMNVVHLALDNIDKYGEYVFLKFLNQEYTNIDIERLSNRLAHGLQQRGLQKDDRVLVFLNNMPEVLISYYAILRAGAIVVPVYPQLRAQELSYIVNHSEPLMIITSARLSKTVQTAINISSIKPLVIEAGEESCHNFIPIEECYAADDTFLMIDRPDDATAAIIYTSGTTGKPKGVILSHFNLYMAGHSDIQVMGLIGTNGTRLIDKVNLLVVLPLSHVYGLCTVAVAYLSGGKIFLLPSFNIEQILDCIEENEITVFGGIPAMYASLAAYPYAKKYNVSSVVRWLCGAAPLSSEIRNSFEERYNATILEGYGLTESVAGFSLQQYDRLIKPGSVGQAIPIADIRVVDEEGKPLPPGQVGELTIKGANVMKGYYKNQAETDRVIRDGWLYTGDIGYMDEDGDIFIIERKKDLIIHKGFNIYPSEVEEVLCSHPNVRAAGVLGVPDHYYGEQVCAFIVLKEGAKTSQKDIHSFCQERLANYKIPHYIEFCDSLPKNELGRILRRELKTKVL